MPHFSVSRPARRPGAGAGAILIPLVLGACGGQGGGDWQGTVTDSAGEFSLFVDPGGEFNLLLRPEADSNLPWALMSNLSVSTSTERVDQVNIQISNPVVMTGFVRGADDSIPQAIVRAYIRPESTGPVVQIGGDGLGWAVGAHERLEGAKHSFGQVRNVDAVVHLLV